MSTKNINVFNDICIVSSKFNIMHLQKFYS